MPFLDVGQYVPRNTDPSLNRDFVAEVRAIIWAEYERRQRNLCRLCWTLAIVAALALLKMLGVW